MEKEIFKGAEAVIILNESKNLIFKDRTKKSYRIPEIDEKIRKRRTKSEKKLLAKAAQITEVPKLIEDDSIEDFRITMENIKGKKISSELENFSEENQFKIFKEIGRKIAKLHDADIIHGDLTTSNMLVEEEKLKVFFIDFGLGYISHKIEDKAVDLHLLKQALEAKHFQNSQKLFGKVLEGYKISENFQKTLERFKAVEKRGRYKENY